MSGEGPESIPTSADPRSRRPTKKRAVQTPTTAQASQLDTLFARPDQPIALPAASASSQKRGPAPPPEIVTNVQGSSAGAGSGEFHVYKAARRREYERLRAMDEEVAAERAAGEFERRKAEREAMDDAKTRKNREKREKKRRAKEKAAAATTGGGKEKGSGGGGGGGSGADIKNVAAAGGGGAGIKPRVDKRKDQENDDEKDAGGDAKDGAGDAPEKPVAGEEIKGIVIEDD
ncbi:DUF1168-domain-containing protein [Xylariomycetidae sp. FL0641]|nr:DUF1168-domain-containing protein [Xylariomycetidae sp. FL0641]